MNPLPWYLDFVNENRMKKSPQEREQISLDCAYFATQTAKDNDAYRKHTLACLNCASETLYAIGKKRGLEVTIDSRKSYD